MVKVNSFGDDTNKHKCYMTILLSSIIVEKLQKSVFIANTHMVKVELITEFFLLFQSQYGCYFRYVQDIFKVKEIRQFKTYRKNERDKKICDDSLRLLFLKSIQSESTSIASKKIGTHLGQFKGLQLFFDHFENMWLKRQFPLSMRKTYNQLQLQRAANSCR